MTSRTHLSLAALLLICPALQCGSSVDDNSAMNAPSGTDAGANEGDARTDAATTDGNASEGGISTDGSLPGPIGCKPIAIDAAKSVDGYTSDVFSYYDGRCNLRSAALVRNDAVDPGGSRGGFLRQMTYEAGGAKRSCNGTGANGWNGFGYVVSHFGAGGGDSDTQSIGGTHRTVFAGKHHAIHEFRARISPGGPVDVTIHWFFATGLSHPIYSITYDATPAGANVVMADTRSPYGDMTWDGKADGNVEGVGRGDKYKFTTTGTGPVTPQSSWDYAKPNIVPYDLEWSSTANAEMGLVQTHTFEAHLAGGDYGGGTLSSDCWTKTSATKGPSCSSNGETMPTNYLWPFQLNQYELPFVTTSHRLAWGASFGAVGQSSYTAFGKTLSGYPFTSYSVYVVFGEHSNGEVLAQVLAVERAVSAQARATKGVLAASGFAGVGRTDTVALSPAAYDHVYGTWDVRADGNAATIELVPGSGALDRPITRVLGYTAGAPPAHVQIAGRDLTPDAEYFASVDTAQKILWITLNQSVTGATQIAIF